MATTTVAGALIGVPTLRLRADYIAIVTLAFGEIIGQVAVNGRDIALFGGTLTPGPIGIRPIDRIDLPFLEPSTPCSCGPGIGSPSPSSSSCSSSTFGCAIPASPGLDRPSQRRGLGSITGVVLGAVVLSVINSYLLPDVLYSVPSRIGFDFDFSAIASGVYGAIIVIVMLLRSEGLVPAR